MKALYNDLSEKATLLVKLTYRDYRFGTIADGTLGRTTVAHVRLGRQNTADARREACLLRMVSIIEAYTDLMFDLALTHDLPSADAITALLVSDALGAASTWPRRKVFGSRYGVPVTAFGQWAQVDSAIAARNSIAHGLGMVTRQQSVRSLQSKLRGVGISIVDGRIHITEIALAGVHSLLVDYIEYMDGTRGPIEH